MKSVWIGIAIGTCLIAGAQQTTSTSTSSSQQQRGSASAKSSFSGSASAGGALGGGTSGSFAMGTKPTHAILWQPGEKWIEEKRTEEQPFFKDHADYLRKLLAGGKIFLSGPWRDDPGGLTLVRAKSDEEAMAIAEGDPMVKAGILTAEVKAWVILMDGVAIGAKAP